MHFLKVSDMGSVWSYHAGWVENKYVEAVDRYLKAIDLNPNVVSYFTNAAAAFALINEHERAVEMAHRAVELCPGFAKVPRVVCGPLPSSLCRPTIDAAFP